MGFGGFVSQNALLVNCGVALLSFPLDPPDVAAASLRAYRDCRLLSVEVPSRGENRKYRYTIY